MRRLFYILIFTVLVFTSCEDDPLKKVDVSESKITVRFDRFDHDVFNADFTDPARSGQQLYQKYRGFYCDYMEVILQAAPCMPDSNFAALQGFVNDRYMSAVQRQIDMRYPVDEIEKVNEEFTDAIRRWNHFFPDSIIPSVAYMNSGLNFSAFSTDSVIAVGLDFYLGPQDSLVKLYPGDIFPQYFKDDMRRDYLTVNAMKDFCWAQCNKFDRTGRNAKLLDILVHQGKVMYLLDALMPHSADSTKMNWSATEMEWAKANEWNVWKELAKQEVMFGTKYNENKKWIDFGPFTNIGAIPQDSPSQLGIWMGWNIVRAYMKENPTLTLQQLFQETDSQKLLKAYKPEKP